MGGPQLGLGMKPNKVEGSWEEQNFVVSTSSQNRASRYEAMQDPGIKPLQGREALESLRTLVARATPTRRDKYSHLKSRKGE
jgi:hypothetical protein